MNTIRRKLHNAILDSREDMQSLSLAAGKNRTYLQQYIRRGQPKHLPADVALAVCDKVNLDWQEFVSPKIAQVSAGSKGSNKTRSIPELDVRAAAGPGALNDAEAPVAWWAFPPEQIQAMGGAINDLAIIRVDGDSMTPLLQPGDRVCVDCSRKAPSPPGVFVLWDGAGLVIKRLEALPDEKIRISSANTDYGTTEQPLDSVEIKGRVVWMSRSL